MHEVVDSGKSSTHPDEHPTAHDVHDASSIPREIPLPERVVQHGTPMYHMYNASHGLIPTYASQMRHGEGPCVGYNSHGRPSYSMQFGSIEPSKKSQVRPAFQPESGSSMDSIFPMVAQDSKPRQSEMARLEEQRKVTQEIYDERGVLRDRNVTETTRSADTRTLAAPTNADELLLLMVFKRDVVACVGTSKSAFVAHLPKGMEPILHPEP